MASHHHDLPIQYADASKNLQASAMLPKDDTPTTTKMTTIARRCANYQPNIWNYDFVQALQTHYTDKIYIKRTEKLKEEVRRMFDEANGSPSTLLKLINAIQRLGVSYHFDDEIKGAIDTMMSVKYQDVCEEEDLFTRALRFRILRQHGFEVSQDVFKSFKEEIMMRSGDLEPSMVLKDVEGMLSLYEASFYAFECEEVLDEVQEFTSRHLKEYLSKGNSIASSPPNILQQLVSHALELPLHWTLPRVEARWFIDTYEKMEEEMNPLLLEFAKLDFNMVQATYHEDLKYVSRWWKELGLIERISFSRDRLVEHFFFAMGFNSEPEFVDRRRQVTKVFCFITAIDDIYDVYGSLDELILFTDAVERWDINEVGELPNYMKMCFLALFNTTNEIAYEILKKHGQDVTSYLSTVWADICKAYLLEAKWYYSGYTPTLEEYVSNAWITVSLPVLATHAFFLMGNETSKEALECLKNYRSSDLIRLSSTISRLLDDLVTSTDELKRGDVSKSIQCYMHETGVSESISRKHMQYLIGDMWKKMNQDRFNSSIFPRSFVDTVENIARMAQCIYQFGDGHGTSAREMKGRIKSIVIEPIPVY